MCGGGGSNQTVTQKTEIDPALRRLLYGGTAANPRGGFGSGGSTTAGSQGDNGPGGGGEAGGGRDNGDAAYSSGTSGGYTSFRDMFDGGGPGLAGTEFGGALGGVSNAAGLSPAEASFGDGIDRGGMYAMGGPVAPQQGIASLNQGQMPMVNGQMPNLSDPAMAATLAMMLRRPQTAYGFAAGGYVQGPGTGTSDSINAQIYQNGVPVQEAALSDGEFVMTERAVQGAGNGDREKGAARMYEMMRQFERGGRV